MSLYRSIGAALETAGSGTTPLDIRKDLGGIVLRDGKFPGSTSPLVSGTAGWAYSIGAGAWATTSATGDGRHVWGNDGAITVGSGGEGTTVPAAPAAGLSRIDRIWVRHPSNGENGDTTSAPTCGVAVGTAASSPTAPALPSGATELASNLMTDAATTTASTGNTITQVLGYATVRGGIVPAVDSADLTALLALGTTAAPVLVTYGGTLRLGDGSTWQHVGHTRRLGSARLASSTTLASTPSWSTLATVTATSTGGVCVASANLNLANANSGAGRTAAYRVTLDTVAMTPAPIDQHMPYVAGDLPAMSAAFNWESTPAAGSHTWVLQAMGSAAASVTANQAVLTVTEHL